MALADLIASLKADAAQHREAVLADAREAARAMRTEAEARSGRLRAESLAVAEREARDEARRSVGRARREASVRVLTARARLLERIRQSVERGIASASTDPAYLATLPHELEAALARLPEDVVEARVSPGLVVPVERATGSHSGVRVVAAPEGPVGFTLSTSDGAVEIDATLQARLELLWPRIAVRVLHEVDT